MPLRLILCADDYAIAPGVSHGILRLILAGRLTATNCLTVSRFWPEHAAWLKPHTDKADIGLHLALTMLRPLGAMPRTCPDGRLPQIRDLTIAAWLGRLELGEIAAELGRQLDAFEAEFGRPPAFLDGHQHVHQLPGIRDVVLDLWKRRLSGSGTWLRRTDEPMSTVLERRVERSKAAIISLLGRGLGRMARARDIPTNDSFAGVQDFSGRVPYAKLFERFLLGAGGRHLVMCHPGYVDQDLRAVDDVTDAREEELAFFESAAFPEMVARHGLSLGRFA
ncbi:MAG TPA: ChbG/HpnK family deacetylase [Alphaproteobacteria bacterium]